MERQGYAGGCGDLVMLGVLCMRRRAIAGLVRNDELLWYEMRGYTEA